MDFNSQKREPNSYPNHGFTGDVDDDSRSFNEHSTINMTDIPPDVKDGTGQKQQMNGNVSRERPETLRRKSSKKKEPWDVFGETSKDPGNQSNIRFWSNISKIARVIFIVMFAVIVCITALVSKLTLIFMLSNINVPIDKNSTSLKTYNASVIYTYPKTEVTWIWAILLCMMAPYIFTMLTSLNKMIFKTTNPVKPVVLIIALFVETVHSVGLCILMFIVLPNLDPVISSIVMLNVGTIPGLLKIAYPSRNRLPRAPNLAESKENSYKMCTSITMNLIIAVLHVGGLGTTSYHILNPPETFVNDETSQNQRRDIVILLVVACVFISIGWWENFVPKGRDYSNGLPKLKRYFMQSRSKIVFITMCWKIVLSSCILPVIYAYFICGTECIDFIYFKHSGDLEVSKHPSIMSTILTDGSLLDSCATFHKWFPFMIAFVYIFMNGLCYKIGKAACKIVAQQLAFGLPIAIATPVALAILLEMMSSSKTGNSAVGTFFFGTCEIKFPYWVSDEKNPILHLTEGEHFINIWPIVVGGFLSYFSLLIITNYIWSPKKERLQPTDKLFVKPLYCGMLLDQSFMLNRRRTDDEYKTTVESNKAKRLPIPEWPDDPEWNPNADSSSTILRKDNTPMIYMCATMWHENQVEMTQVLKSICRMDEDQCSRRNLMMFFGIQDPDYYEFEAHIFFDDAFEPHAKDEYEYRVNGFVKILVDCIDTAASAVHNKFIKVADPTKVPTPYGGQLIWRLPGGNTIVAHLKDKTKIRHKKRWSQVMYMYYFLGHKLMGLKKRRKAKETIAQNTFILALDGDVDFQPSAVQLLVDRMKKNLNVGAACGRIHPIGSGPMVWYQKFEYAVSHWLQKAAEHVLGSVLCSPGCFSLFRGASLMDDNVMRKYTALPTEAYQHVQYDQGEDRWLCTLLLQQGYKVEYVAASDALTFAPEGFYEFYNQRRRWSPSTMANIIDLLMDWKNVTKKNDDISLLCVAYQMLLLASSLLTPGTILLMILGALYTAFPQIQPWTAFICNLIPVVIMVILCFVAKKEVQLSYAALLSTVYALVMMIVIVGLLKESVEAGFCSVTTYFLFFVAAAFVISAMLHPQEIWCLLHGMLYFLAIPSMSMLMIIFALGNLNDISWGTRDAGTANTASPTHSQQQSNSKLNDIRNWVMGPSSPTNKATSDYQFSFGNLFRCMCCPQSGTQSEDVRLRAILDRLDDIDTKMTTMSHQSIGSFPRNNDMEDIPEIPFSGQAYSFEGAGEERLNPLFTTEKQKPRDELKCPFWLEDTDLKYGSTKLMEGREIGFWENFIERYLKPLEYKEEHKKKIEKDLLQLRNKVCLAFLLMNALFVTIVYTLTEVNKQEHGTLSVKIPCETNSDSGYGQGHIEPISFAFTAVFGIMLFVQFVCMLFHRYSTLLHVISSSEINFKKKVRDTLFKENEDEQREIGVEEGLELVRQMQSDNQDADSDTSSVCSSITDNESEYDGDTIGPNKGKNLGKKLAKRRRHITRNTLSKNFLRNFSKLQKVVDSEETASMNPESNEDNGKNPEEKRISFVREGFGAKRFTQKSMKTVVTMIQNEGIKEQIKRRGEHMEKLKQLERERAKGIFKSAVLKVGGGRKTTILNIVSQAKQKEKLEQIDEKIEQMKLKTSKSGSGVPSEDLDVVPEQRDSISVSRESMSSDDNDDITRLPGDSDSDSDHSNYRARAEGGSLHFDNSHDSNSMTNSDVLF